VALWVYVQNSACILGTI
jgi:hypothetical protein